MPSLDLQTCLTRTPWRQLLAIMARHGLPCSTRWNKAQLVATLHAHLLQPSSLAMIIPQLSADGQQALQALGQADGALPATPFFQAFGTVRPYRPWRADERAEEPWRHPASPAEQLWYLGLLYLDPPRPQPGVLPRVILPADLLPQLAPLLTSGPPESGAYGAPQLLPRPGLPPDLTWHLALWLATSQEQAVRPRRGGWLPPTVLAKLTARMGLPPTVPAVALRSERQAPYLAFLHDLANAAGLAIDQPGWDLTVAGWQWLAAPAAERWQQLWQAWLAAPVAAANPFYFAWASLAPPARALILTQVRQLTLTTFTPLVQLVEQVQYHDVYGHIPRVWGEAENAGASSITAFCTGPLFWFGIIDLARLPANPGAPPRAEIAAVNAPITESEMDTSVVAASELGMRLTAQGAWLLGLADWGPPAFAEPVPCRVAPRQPDCLWVAPTVAPVHLARLAPLSRWSPPSAGAPEQQFHLAAEHVGQAVAGGESLAQILQIVTTALGQPPSRRLGQRLRAWAQAGAQVSIQPLVVLTTADAGLMGRLRSRKLVRRHLETALSPTRSAIDPAGLPALVQTLRTLGIYAQTPPAISDALRPAAEPPAEAASPDGLATRYADMLWLLVALYQGLSAVVDLPVRLPSGLLDAIHAHLTPPQQATAASASQRVLTQIEASLQGYLRLPAWQWLVQPPDLLATIETALAAQQDLQITYWGAGRDQKTVRRVTPYWLETREAALYLIAYCHLRQAERVFRLDRIEACRGVTGGGERGREGERETGR